MRRREFFGLIAGLAVAWPLAARAQQPSGMKRIGVLMPSSAADPVGKVELAVFAHELQRLGWTDGGSVHIDYRWSDGDTQRMHDLANELSALQPDVLFVRGTPATTAVAHNTGTIPIVFVVVSDPVGDGLVASLARPGGNVTGFTNAEASLTGKWLGLLKDVAPAIERVAFLFDPKLAPGGGAYYTNLVQAAAKSSGVVGAPLPVHSPDDIERILGDFAGSPNGGLLVLPDGTMNFHRTLIIALAAKYRLPAIYTFRNFADEGGLMSYGVHVPDLFRRAAGYVDRILKGARPAELPVQLPEKFEFVINQKTAKTLGLSIPSGVLAIADELIE